MSTLAHNRPAFGPILLFFAFFLILLASLPPLADSERERYQAAAASGSPLPPPPPEWRWGGHRTYNRCSGTAIEHIICRHGAASRQSGGKFYTNSRVEIRRLVETAMKKGELFGNDKGWRVTYEFGKKIGTNDKGESSKMIEILLSEAGELLTAYPL